MPYGQVLRIRQLAAAALKDSTNATACRYSAACRAAGADAEMRLQRDVAEILEREHAEILGMAQNSRHRHRHRRKQLARC